MKRKFGFLCSLAAGLLLASTSTANDRGVLSSASVSPAGLTMEWFAQVDIGPGGEIVDMDLVVDENKSTTYFALVHGTSREIISQDMLDAFGNPYGIEGAQKQATQRKEILAQELKALGRETEIEIQQYTLPKTSIYTLSSAGTVTCMDADTGQIHWKIKIGKRRFRSIGLGANEHYVAAVNGSSVYCMNAENGKVIFKQPCSGSVSASPAVTGKPAVPVPAGLEDEQEIEEFKLRNQASGHVFVPLNSGRLEGFPIVKNGVGSESFVAVGRSMARPLVTEKNVSWPTAAGHYNVAAHDRLGPVSFRIVANDSIVCPGTSQGGMLFVTSLDGNIYAVSEKSGGIEWEFSSGERISQSPIPVGNHLFVITDDHKMLKVDARFGGMAEGWEKPLNGIHKFVGTTKDKIYVTDRTGLLALDIKTGQRLAKVDNVNLSLILPNYQTDRLYVGNASGLIHCLHETGSKIPHFHSGEFIADVDSTEMKTEEVEEEMSTEDDPFKEFDTPGKDEKDPFGGDDDDDSDPFGGGSDDDPFGG